MCNDNNKYAGFLERLIQLRDEKAFSTKTEFAKWLGVARNTYSMVESGYRPPTKNFIEQLFIKTGKPEEYWLYGIETESEYKDNRTEFKMLRKAIDDILELNLMTLDGEYTSQTNRSIAKSLLETALDADLLHILLKKKQDK